MAVLTIFGRGGPLYTPDHIVYDLGDVLSALILCYAGVCGLLTWRAFRGHSADAPYWLLAGLGMLYLAVDEVFGLHELVGTELWHRGWIAPEPFTHNDDALLFLIALGGLVVTALYFRALLEHRQAARLLLAGLVATGLVVVFDWMHVATIVEEGTELVAAFILGSAFATRLHRHEAAAEPLLAAPAVVSPDTAAPPS
jgi:hypothetical protein